jgi:hypothetical protein
MVGNQLENAQCEMPDAELLANGHFALGIHRLNPS